MMASSSGGARRAPYVQSQSHQHTQVNGGDNSYMSSTMNTSRGAPYVVHPRGRYDNSTRGDGGDGEVNDHTSSTTAIPVAVATALPISGSCYGNEGVAGNGFGGEEDYGATAAAVGCVDPSYVRTVVGNDDTFGIESSSWYIHRDPGTNDHDLDDVQVQKLREQGFTAGLAHELGHTRATYPIRFWIVDNSGSMRTNDGHQIRGNYCNACTSTTITSVDHQQIRVIDCNRWIELQGTVEYHAELAGLLQATTIFRLLNDPGAHIGNQEFSVATKDSSFNKLPYNEDEDVRFAKYIIARSEPQGVTPLTEHLHYIRRRIESVASQLRAYGQRAVIVIATDGLPSNDIGESTKQVQDEFIHALRSLQTLPVWVVVRLCTDDDEITEYYNDLDKILELPLEVIDDFFGEAQEIRQANKWLNYGLPLHRCREMGYHHRIFDLLDERMLNKDELWTFLKLLFGETKMSQVPDPNLDWSGFYKEVERIVQEEGKVWNPHTKNFDYWIDLRKLDKKYNPKRQSGFGRLFFG